jgi:formylglycine-generating enzyme required for sulfatase activity
MLRAAARIFVSLMVLAFAGGAAMAAKRVVLVIGNSAYTNASALTNPKNDAQDMAAALKALGFTVILGTDLDKRAMDRKILEFAGALSGADAGACADDGGCGGYKPSDQSWGRGDRQVINVSWDDAQSYVKWLSAKTGRYYRLLSEAEREYAARAGKKSPFWWGASVSAEQANYDGNYTYNGGGKGEYRQRTLPAQSFHPNPWGLYQVHGNVYDLVEDCYHDNYNGAPSDGSAWTTGECKTRVLRGGSWDDNPRRLRAAFRFSIIPGFRDSDRGFRVALGWQDLNR